MKTLPPNVKVIKLENWSLTEYSNNGYWPPEWRTAHLVGEAYGHPKHRDGEKITSTRIIESTGRYVRTKNNWYELGRPDPNYVAWLATQGKKIDPDYPVKVSVN